ncbi:MAG: segregation/condensation protein A [Eubacteriales bacterium]
MENLSLKLEEYEGPLDLLLSLIQKQKIDIFNIPIAELTDQYMEYIEAAKTYNMALSSDFIYMASELMLIKSKTLLPARQKEDPVKPLVDALLEYQRAKALAGFLKEQGEKYFDRFVKDKLEVETSYEVSHSVELLMEALRTLAAKTKPSGQKTELFEKLGRDRYYSVEGKIIYTIKFLYDGKRHMFDALFGRCRSKGEIVALFLALLQLVGSGRVNVVREQQGGVYLNLIKDGKNGRNRRSGNQ